MYNVLKKQKKMHFHCFALVRLYYIYIFWIGFKVNYNKQYNKRF